MNILMSSYWEVGTAYPAHNGHAINRKFKYFIPVCLMQKKFSIINH